MVRRVPLLNLEGQKKSGWTVLSEASRQGNSKMRYYTCQCECGYQRVFTVSYLQSSTLSKCKRCLLAARLKQKEDELVGKQRGSYTVLQFAGSNKFGTRTWLCRCSCGVETVYSTSQLLSPSSQRTRCVACYQSDMELSNRVTDHIPARFLSRAQDHAARRGIEWTLSYEDLYKLYAEQGKQCALSGESLYFSRFRTNFNRYTNASIDRIDSDLPYTIANVQWVSKKINMMKGSLSQQEFISWCSTVAARFHVSKP